MSKLSVTRTNAPKTRIPKEQLKFGALMSDHMFEVDWTSAKGWGTPRIVPYGNLQLDPACSVFHYGLECFEGLKAYRDVNDPSKVRLFRPDMNHKRMFNSCHRLLLPTFSQESFVDALKHIVRVEKEWIPEGMGYSLYLRPTMIGTHPFLGVQPPLSAKFFIIASPVGPYYPEGFNPVKLMASTQYVRAWPGGTGNCKVGGNYALGMLPALEAQKRGYAQILWLFGDNLEVTEVGTMNQFFFWRREKDNKAELITAPLDGTILPGVTRDSILSLVRQWGEFEVTERTYSLKEVIKAIEQGRLIEAFGAGTAAIVSPVKGFEFNGKEYVIPLDKDDPKAKAGKLTSKLADVLMGIQYGKIRKDEWSIVV